MSIYTKWPRVTGILIGIACVTMNGCAGPGLPQEAIHDGGRGEELWVIEKSDGPDRAPAVGNLNIGTGTLLAKPPDNRLGWMSIPLQHTEVNAAIARNVATVQVAQRFQNPFTTAIEVLYAFPLPQDARVTEFVVTIGPRKIRGIIRDRTEARRIYREAKLQGFLASLLTQATPGLYVQSIANIEPRSQIDIDFQYIHPVRYVLGWYEFKFPMVSSDATLLNALNPESAKGMTVRGQSAGFHEVLPPTRSGRDIAVSVHFDADTRLEQVQCMSHEIVTEQNAAHASLDVKTAGSASISNRDFVLRYTVTDKNAEPGAVAAERLRGIITGWLGGAALQQVTAISERAVRGVTEYLVASPVTAFITVDVMTNNRSNRAAVVTIPAGVSKRVETQSNPDSDR